MRIGRWVEKTPYRGVADDSDCSLTHITDTCPDAKGCGGNIEQA